MASREIDVKNKELQLKQIAGEEGEAESTQVVVILLTNKE
jgi:hypothetical protein